MLGAQGRAYSLRLARHLQPWRVSGRQIALSLPKSSILELVDPHFTLGFASPNAPRERSKNQMYTTSMSSVAKQAVALLQGNKIEEAASLISQSPNDDSREQLVLEVVEGFLESETALRDPENLFSWLELFPDATSASSGIFHHIFDQLVGHNSYNLRPIQRLGVLSASKGYQDFVAVYISPFLSENATADEFIDWEHQIQEATAVFKGLKTHSGSVLEEDDRDYNSIGARAVPGPTILQLVEATLPKILPATSVQDEMVLEDQSDEYILYTTEATVSSKSPTSEALENLVRRSEYEDAYQLLLELEELGTTPAPSAIYQSAAVSVLEDLLHPDAPLKEQVALELEKKYMSWLGLLPPKHLLEAGDSLPFIEIEHHLLHGPAPDYWLVSQTAMVLASKGFARDIVAAFNRILFSVPSSPFDARFILQLEDTNRQYWERYRPEKAQRRIATITGLGRTSAIRSLAVAGRFDVAIDLLPPPAADWYIHPSVYSGLIRQLHISGPEAVAKYQQTVVQNSSYHINRYSAFPNYEGPAPPDQSLEYDLPKAFEYLQAAFQPGLPPPHPMNILPFIEGCLDLDRPGPLTTLLNQAMDAGYLHTSAFLYAEMLYYYRQRRGFAVLETVLDHFYFGAGLPKSKMLDLFQERTRKPGYHSQRFHDKKLLNPPSRSWPSSAHCNLAWSILASRPSPTHLLEDLYKSLRVAIAVGKRLAGRVDGSASRAYRSTLNRLPSEAAFTHFIRKLSDASGPERGMEIIHDMLQLGLKPGIAQFSEVMHQYARAGNRESAMSMLTKLEANLKRIRDEEGREPNVGTEHRVPYGSPLNKKVVDLVPDCTLYVSMARAFIIARDEKLAAEVLRRLEESGLSPTSEEEPYLRSVYEDLAAMKSDRKPSPWKEEEQEYIPPY